VLALGLVSVAGFFFLAVSLTAVIANTGLRELLRKYRAGTDQEEQRKPRSWAEVHATEEQTRGTAGEETRGWRDLWKPWESRGR